MAIQLMYGLPGMGKTTLMHDLIRAQATVLRWFVVDHAAEWGPEALHWRGKAPEIHVMPLGEDIPSDMPDTGVFVFQGWEGNDVANVAVSLGNCVYVDDEIDLVARRKGWETSALRNIVHRGRHLVADDGEVTECHIMGACRRPQNLHTDLTDLADQVYIFRVQGNRTLQRLQSDSMIEDEEWDTIRTLPKFACRHWPSGEYLKVKPIGGATEDEQQPTPGSEKASPPGEEDSSE